MNDVLSRMNDLVVPPEQEHLKQERIQYISNLENHSNDYYRIIGRFLEILTVFNITENKEKSNYKIAHKIDNDRLYIIKTKNTVYKCKLVITEESKKESYKVTFGCNDLMSISQNYNDPNYSDPINNIMQVYYKHNKTNLMDEKDYYFTIKYEVIGRFIFKIQMKSFDETNNSLDEIAMT